jgi:hypothetical protein
MNAEFDFIETPPSLPMDFADPLVLESVTVDTLKAELESKANRAKLRELADRRLCGTAGDLTPMIPALGMQGPVPLLSREWVA